MSENVGGVSSPNSPQPTTASPPPNLAPGPQGTGSTLSPSMQIAANVVLPSSSSPVLSRSILEYTTALGDAFLHLLRISKDIDLENSLIAYLQNLSAMSGLALTDQQIREIIENFEGATGGVNDAGGPTTNLSSAADDVVDAKNGYNSERTNYNNAKNTYEDAVEDYNDAVEAYILDGDEDAFTQARAAYDDAVDDYNEARSDLISAANHYNNRITAYKNVKTTYENAIEELNEVLEDSGEPPLDISGLISDQDLEDARVTLPTIPEGVPRNGTIEITVDLNVVVPQAVINNSALNPPSLPEINFNEFIGPWLKDGAAAAAFAKAQSEKQEEGENFELLSLFLMRRGDTTPSGSAPGDTKTSKVTVALTTSPSPEASFLAAIVTGLGSTDTVTQVSNNNLAAALSSAFNKSPKDILLRAKLTLKSAFDSAALFGITAKIGLQDQVFAHTDNTTHTGAMAMALGPAVSLLGMAASPQLEEAIRNSLYTSQEFTLLTAAQQNTVVDLLTTAVGLSLLSTSTALLGSSGVAPSLQVQSLLAGISSDLSQSNAATTVDGLRKSVTPEQASVIKSNVKLRLADTLKSLEVENSEEEAERISTEATNSHSKISFNDYIDTELKKILGAKYKTSLSGDITSLTLFEFLAARFPPLTQMALSKKAFSDLKTRLASQFSAAIRDQVEDQLVASKKGKEIADILANEFKKYMDSPTSLAGRMDDFRKEVSGILPPGIQDARSLSTTLVMKGFTTLANIQLRESFEGNVGRSTAQALSDEITNTIIKRDEIARDLLRKVVQTNNQKFLDSSVELLADSKTPPGLRLLLEPSKTFDGIMWDNNNHGFHRGHIDVHV